MTEHVIGPATRVTLHFAIKLEDGTVVDSNYEGAPATFSMGDGNLLPGFEQALEGMKAGEKGILRIAPEQGFGMSNPSNVQRIARERFTDMELQPGLVVSFADPGQGELPGVIREFDEKQVTIDFNHPLAGRTLLFDVAILNVEPV